jgi:ribosomal protein S18 acetylase RimI-like enzyme
VTAAVEDARPPYELLVWDTEHFGIRLGRIRERRLGTADLRDAIAWADAEHVACLYLLADAAAADTHRLAQGHGFRFVDVRVTLGGSVPEDRTATARTDFVVRRPHPGDAELLASVATEAHRDSRFYADGRFDGGAVNRLYQRWVSGCFDGTLADHVLVAEADGGPVGYVTARIDWHGQHGAIQLVGVAPGERGRGIGRALVRSALRDLAEAGIATASVVTQGRNVAAMGLYQACGLRIELVELWFHRWADEQARAAE